ncbi:MAG: 2OG-Fe(II) oxygenase [Gammaproteobacteria bacterium]|nr:2OG-Fe(II) oxygenase [Gammaproteobacteria bacterium]
MESASLAPLPAAAEAALFERFATALRDPGWAVVPDALPPALGAALLEHVVALDDDEFVRAGIGRQAERATNDFVRRNAICWISGDRPPTRAWVEFAARLRAHLNRSLMLGLFSFESHFAHYPVGGFYKRHVDAFRGETNRVVSLVTYLNPGWAPHDGGELVLYPAGGPDAGVTVTPAFGTVVLFLSEEIPHEVLPARRPRRSIAGWYRVRALDGTCPD